jgi:hypothetical protein
MKKKLLPIDALIEDTQSRTASEVERVALENFLLDSVPDLKKKCACYRCAKGLPAISYFENKQDRTKSYFSSSIMACGRFAVFDGNTALGLNVPTIDPFHCAGAVESEGADHE